MPIAKNIERPIALLANAQLNMTPLAHPSFAASKKTNKHTISNLLYVCAISCRIALVFVHLLNLQCSTRLYFSSTSLPIAWSSSSSPNAQSIAATVNSAAIDRRRCCELCNESYISISEHVYYHLDQPIFGCKLCTYTHKTSIPTVHRHIKYVIII